mmetsp:Transcript_21267/g.23603  ORF Transcript_21267/g.23603 Transcript_21267/m.23603 type:complete len:202 (-) Transcript_21267:65-670(-)
MMAKAIFLIFVLIAATITSQTAVVAAFQHHSNSLLQSSLNRYRSISPLFETEKEDDTTTNKENAPPQPFVMNIAGLGAPGKRLKMPFSSDVEYDKDSVRVKNLINSEAVVVFSSLSCPFCDKVKELLNSKKVAFHTVELDDKPDIRAEMASIIDGRASVPAVFVNGEFIGGCNDGGKGGVLPLNESCELDKLLSQAGVSPE